MPDQEIEDFFGVYCLCSKNENPRLKGRCYIGFTVNPNRREKQHNRGKDFGGARRTSNRGPWIMVMIVHGFPNKIAALRFEWAWQKPGQSRILRHIPGIDKKQYKETHLDHHLRILSAMLRTPPFCRLPLTIQWLSDEYLREFPIEKSPPMHMPIKYGRIKIKKKVSDIDNDIIILSQQDAGMQFCDICNKYIQSPLTEMITCLNSSCKMMCHIYCLAGKCLHGIENKGELIPINGVCPVCDVEFLWGDMIRKKKGCNDIVDDLNNTDALEIGDISEDEIINLEDD